jgi:NAD(P)H-nitrite reductase large subunit
LQSDDEVCLCFHVTKRKILNYIRLRQPRVASQVSECASAGTGCGWCIPFLKRYFTQETGRSADLSGSDASQLDEAVTAEEYARQRGTHIRSGKGKPPPGATPPPPEAAPPEETT